MIVDYYDIVVRENHRFEGGGLIARTGENRVAALRITPPPLAMTWYLEFQLPDGGKYATAALEISDDILVYPITNVLTQCGGCSAPLVVELVGRNEDGEVWKSAQGWFRIAESLCASEEILDGTPDLVSDITNRLDDVEKTLEQINGDIGNAVEEYMRENPVMVKADGITIITNEEGALCVNTTTEVESDNTLPITSSGVYEVVGNINALLETI